MGAAAQAFHFEIEVSGIQCVAQRRALLGLDAMPAPTPMEGFDVNVSLEVRRERVLTLFSAISERERIGGGAVEHEEHVALGLEQKIGRAHV